MHFRSCDVCLTSSSRTVSRESSVERCRLFDGASLHWSTRLSTKYAVILFQVSHMFTCIPVEITMLIDHMRREKSFRCTEIDDCLIRKSVPKLGRVVINSTTSNVLDSELRHDCDM